MKFKSYLKFGLRSPIILFFLVSGLILVRLTDYVHVSIFLSRIPFKTGNIIRALFYKYTLSKFGSNVVVNYGTVISYQNTCIGNNVWLGTYNILGSVDINDNVITGQGCHLISQGKLSPKFQSIEIPMKQQDIITSKITIGPDVWIGAGSIIGVNLNQGTIVSAGSVITEEVPSYSILSGNPAKIIDSRNA